MVIISNHSANTNWPTQGEPYARPTAMHPRDPSVERRHQHSKSFGTPSTATAFTTLSSVAMEELYVLEKQEALRRAEYELRHSEALRRAERETSRTRLSKSANNTPLSTPTPFTAYDTCFAISNDRDDEDVAMQNYQGQPKRRLSGPAWMSPRTELIHPHPSGHVVNSNQPTHGHAQIHGHGSWGHPYHNPSSLGSHHPHLPINRTDDSPSPISSDSDSFHLAHQSPQYAAVAHSHLPPTSSYHTPSTSPFLGPMRKLNLYSAEPSRAPSPFQLPPATLSGDLPSPTEERRQMVESPPRKSGFSGVRRRSSGDLARIFTPTTSTFPPNERGSAGMPTPQLSSGPSSNDSSPGSHPHSLAHAPVSSIFAITGDRSAISSRAPSPPSWSSPHVKSHSTSNVAIHHPPRDSHNHIAHSLRLAFGMTPIHPQARSGSRTAPGGATPFTFGAHSMSAMSMPVSRSSSPPITLPPLHLNSSPSSPKRRSASPMQERMEVEEPDRTVRGRVALPGFHEFEAATGTTDFKLVPN